MKRYSENMGQRITDARLRKRMSTKELAMASGVSEEVIRAVERKSHNIWHYNLIRIADSLDVRVSELTGNERDDYVLTGELIKAKRMAIGMAKDQLAKLTGISVNTITAYESCYTKVRPDRLESIAYALKTPTSELKGYYLYDRNKASNPEVIPYTEKITAICEDLTDEAQEKILDFARTIALVPSYRKHGQN